MHPASIHHAIQRVLRRVKDDIRIGCHDIVLHFGRNGPGSLSIVYPHRAEDIVNPIRALLDTHVPDWIHPERPVNGRVDILMNLWEETHGQFWPDINITYGTYKSEVDPKFEAKPGLRKVMNNHGVLDPVNSCRDAAKLLEIWNYQTVHLLIDYPYYAGCSYPPLDPLSMSAYERKTPLDENMTEILQRSWNRQIERKNQAIAATEYLRAQLDESKRVYGLSMSLFAKGIMDGAPSAEPGPAKVTFRPRREAMAPTYARLASGRIHPLRAAGDTPLEAMHRMVKLIDRRCAVAKRIDDIALTDALPLGGGGSRRWGRRVRGGLWRGLEAIDCDDNGRRDLIHDILCRAVDPETRTFLSSGTHIEDLARAAAGADPNDPDVKFKFPQPNFVMVRSGDKRVRRISYRGRLYAANVQAEVASGPFKGLVAFGATRGEAVTFLRESMEAEAVLAQMVRDRLALEARRAAEDVEAQAANVEPQAAKRGKPRRSRAKAMPERDGIEPE